MKRRNVTEMTPSGMANPFIDTQFKLIFDERNTMRFLNSILKPTRPIVKVEFENTESNDTSLYGHRIYFDVVCTDSEGRKFIVEMQNAWEKFLRNRIIYYACRKIDEMGRKYDEEWRNYTAQMLEEISRQKPKAPKYGLQPVCIICLLNDTDRDLTEQCFRQDAVLYDTENKRIFSDKLRIIMINLRQIEPKNMGIDTEYYENVLILMHQIAENMTNAEALIAEIDATPYDEESKALFRWVVSVSDLSRMDEKERAIYEERRKFYLDSMALLYAEHDEGRAEGRAQGRVEGRAEGRAEGMAQGRAEGMAQGRAEGLAAGRIEERETIAAKLKKQGLSLSLIAQATGMPESDIARL